MISSDKKIAIFGCKQTTQFIADFLCRTINLNHLVTIGPWLAEKNEVADFTVL